MYHVWQCVCKEHKTGLDTHTYRSHMKTFTTLPGTLLNTMQLNIQPIVYLQVKGEEVHCPGRSTPQHIDQVTPV